MLVDEAALDGSDAVLLVEESQRLATTDGLTGLHNRRYLERHLGVLVQQAIARTKPLSLVIIDIDHFKSINDQYGHGAGDEVLREFSRRVRKAFGRSIGDFQALQFKLADMATELEAARLMIRHAASMLDARHPKATMYCAMAKRYATDAGFAIANDALQIHGGYGYLKDFPLERHVRDLRVHQILEGTNEIMRVIIARELGRQ